MHTLHTHGLEQAFDINAVLQGTNGADLLNGNDGRRHHFSVSAETTTCSAMPETTIWRAALAAT